MVEVVEVVVVVVVSACSELEEIEMAHYRRNNIAAGAGLSSSSSSYPSAGDGYYGAPGGSGSESMMIRIDPRGELDDQVAMLGQSVSSLKHMARSINEEVNVQNNIIAQLVRIKLENDSDLLRERKLIYTCMPPYSP